MRLPLFLLAGCFLQIGLVDCRPLSPTPVAAAEASVDPTAARLSPLIALLGKVDDPDIQKDVLAGILQAMEGRRSQMPPGEWDSVGGRLMSSRDEEVQRRAMQLAVLFGDPIALATLTKVLNDPQAAKAEREQALQVLLPRREAGLARQLQALVSDAAIRGAAIRALAAFDDAETPGILLKSYAGLTESEKRDAVSTLATRAEYALALLGAVESKVVPAKDLSTFTARQLSGLKNAAVQKKLELVWGSVRPTSGDKAKLVAEYRSQLSAEALSKADRSQGRLVYSRICGNCHRLFDDGRAVGPELTGSQRKSVEYLLENLIDPSAVVGRDYRLSVLTTTDGRVLTGIVKQENENAVVLLTANDQVSVPRDEIEDRVQQTVSLMPEGVLQKLSPTEIRDLFGYIAGDTQAPLPAK